jgi:hypothetical protein
MPWITEEYTFTDGFYFCNICDEPHEDPDNAEECYRDCYLRRHPLEHLADQAD